MPHLCHLARPFLMPSEFDLIARYFTRPVQHTVLGVGDDGAVIRPSAGMELVITTDMLVSGTHFLADTDTEALGWKSLAVNLSDLAAMGAEPRWAVVAVALPSADEAWVAAFASGFFAAADAFNVDVIGGDTTRGPLNIAPTVFGEVPQGQALTRAKAQIGDDLWVSGMPGRAALGLAYLQGRAHLDLAGQADCVAALLRPQPRVALGVALRGVASAAIDISDGLLADIGHILKRSEVAADIQFASLPRAAHDACSDESLATACLLTGGDDYELAFTAPTSQREKIAALSRQLRLPLSRIGCVTAAKAGSIGEVKAGEENIYKAVVRDAEGNPLVFDHKGYDHFGGASS